jgi:uncharacterized protein with HEPN domain
LSEERIESLREYIRRECLAGLAFVDGVERDDFLSDPMMQHAVAMSLVIIGETASKIAKASPDFVTTHPEIPWTSIVGMRNRIAHSYYGLDFEVVWDTMKNAIPDLLASLPEV